MKKLIYLEDAIEALEKVASLYPCKVPGERDTYDTYNEAWNDAIGRAEIELEKLPSAFPCPEGFDPAHLTEQDKKDILEVLEWMKGTIAEEVPSAEPEIIRCKDCRWWAIDDKEDTKECRYLGSYWGAEDFCGDGERREDEEVR